MANLMDLIREIQGVRHQAEPVDDSGVYEPGLQVDGAVPRAAPVDQSQYLLSQNAPDLRNTEWAQAAVDARNENDKKVEHKGMFGVKGTLREVLGTLGDAFLVQGGAKPIYAPTRQRERMGDAMAGYTQAPRSAAERMTAVDPEFAQAMGKNIMDQEIARARAEQQAQKEAAARYAVGIEKFGGLMGSKGLDNVETYSQVKPILEKIKSAYGLGDEFKIPDQYDSNYAAAVSSGAIKPYQQRTLEDADERIDQSGRRVDISEGQLGVAQQRASETGRHNRAMEARPTSAGRPANPTNASLAAPLLRKVQEGKRLTPAEDETLTRLGYPSDRGKGKGRSNRPNVKPPTNNRFR